MAATTRRFRTSHFFSRTRVACGLGSGRSRPPPLSVRSGRWYVACSNSFGRSLHPCTRRRRLRLPLPLAYEDHLLPRRGFVVERAIQVAVAHNSAAGSPRRTVAADFVVYGATSNGEALCRDATVSPLTRAGRPVPGADAREGVALVAARRRKVARYPELTRGEPQRLIVLTAQVGGRWSDECQQFLRTYSGSVSKAPHYPCAPLQPRAGRAAGGVCCRLPCSEPSPAPHLESGPYRRCLVPLGDVLDLAVASALSALPLR